MNKANIILEDRLPASLECLKMETNQPDPDQIPTLTDLVFPGDPATKLSSSTSWPEQNEPILSASPMEDVSLSPDLFDDETEPALHAPKGSDDKPPRLKVFGKLGKLSAEDTGARLPDGKNLPEFLNKHSTDHHDSHTQDVNLDDLMSYLYPQEEQQTNDHEEIITEPIHPVEKTTPSSINEALIRAAVSQTLSEYQDEFIEHLTHIVIEKLK